MKLLTIGKAILAVATIIKKSQKAGEFSGDLHDTQMEEAPGHSAVARLSTHTQQTCWSGCTQSGPDDLLLPAACDQPQPLTSVLQHISINAIKVWPCVPFIMFYRDIIIEGRPLPALWTWESICLSLSWSVWDFPPQITASRRSRCVWGNQAFSQPAMCPEHLQWVDRSTRATSWRRLCLSKCIGAPGILGHKNHKE